MTMEEIRKKIESSEYDFLRNDPRLQNNNIIILTVGGSHAYGTSNEKSDLDIRGIYYNTPEDILLMKEPGQIIDNTTDTTLYSFNKMIHLLAQCNPNCIEILGNENWQYLQMNMAGDYLLENRELFLSQRCINTFGGYAISQLRRLENISNKYVSQSAQEKHILDSIFRAKTTFPETYFPMDKESSINLYIDDAVQEDMETEIFMDVNLKHYPLRDYTSMWNDMKSIVSSYKKIGKRNQHAIDHNKIGKHMMHLIRLYIMCLDILEKKVIKTYREEEHDMLMEIRNGKYLDDNQQPIPEFYEMVDDFEKKLDEAAKNTDLPEHPDMEKINKLVMDINRDHLMREIYPNEYKNILKKEI